MSTAKVVELCVTVFSLTMDGVYVELLQNTNPFEPCVVACHPVRRDFCMPQSLAWVTAPCVLTVNGRNFRNVLRHTGRLQKRSTAIWLLLRPSSPRERRTVLRTDTDMSARVKSEAPTEYLTVVYSGMLGRENEVVEGAAGAAGTRISVPEIAGKEKPPNLARQGSAQRIRAGNDESNQQNGDRHAREARPHPIPCLVGPLDPPPGVELAAVVYSFVPGTVDFHRV